MFLGAFEHTLDSKSRLTIPSKFRDELESGVVITRGLDGCLWAFGRSEWEKLTEKLSQLPTTNRNARNFTRFMFSSAFDSIPDRQGRILIPQNLRVYAGIQSDAIVTGANNRVEIWSPDRWGTILDEVEGDPEAFVSQLEELGI